MEITIVDLPRRLKSPVPKQYEEYVAKTKPATLKRRGFDPKTLCVLNLELRAADTEGWTKGRFFLSGDGCGNYCFVDDSKRSASTNVLLWSHDPPGIEDCAVDLLSFLTTAEQMNPIVKSIDPNRLCIARTDSVGESILDPIELHEWKEAIAKCAGVEYPGHLNGLNPMTGEPIRIERPGTAVANVGDKSIRLTLFNGRVEGKFAKAFRSIAESLATALKARLVVRSR